MKQRYESKEKNMAKQIEGVYEKVIACAKAEFLEKGYINASLRNIASDAGTTTGSIYTRFGDKEGLFEAIVGENAEELLQAYLQIQKDFHNFDKQVQMDSMAVYTNGEAEHLIDYIYDHFDVFRLLICCANGTKYEDFIDQFIDIEVEYTYKYIQIIGCESIQNGSITEDFLHIIISSYSNGFFEVVRHNMSREEAKKYNRQLGRYHRAGFETIFWPQENL